MGLLGLLIAAIIIVLFFVYSNFSNSSSIISPENSKNIQTEAQDAVNSEAEKSKIEQDRIKNIDLR